MSALTKQRHRQLQFGEQLGQAEHADAIAVVAPSVIEHVRLMRGGHQFGAEPFAEREPFEIERDIDRQPFSARPVVDRAGGDRGVGIAVVVRGGGMGGWYLLFVVPAKAGTHNPGLCEWGNGNQERLLLNYTDTTRRMGPRLRGDDNRVANAPPPVFFAAPGTPYSISSPSKNRGDGAPSGASCSRKSRAVSGTWRLSARHRGVLTAPGRASGDLHRPAFGPPARPLLGGRAFAPQAGRAARPSASSSRQVIVPAGGAPAPPGRGGAFVSRRAGAASDPINNHASWRAPSVDRTPA